MGGEIEEIGVRLATKLGEKKKKKKKKMGVVGGVGFRWEWVQDISYRF